MVVRAEVPKFVVGQDSNGSEFVVHLAEPKFVARIADVGDDGIAIYPDDDADVISGITYSGDGFVICQIVHLSGPAADISAALVQAGKLVSALRDDGDGDGQT